VGTPGVDISSKLERRNNQDVAKKHPRLKAARKLQGWKWADRGSARKCSGQVIPHPLLLEMGQQPPRYVIAGVLESADEQISGQPCKDGGPADFPERAGHWPAALTGSQGLWGASVACARDEGTTATATPRRIGKGRRKKRVPRPKVRVRIQGCGAHCTGSTALPIDVGSFSPQTLPRKEQAAESWFLWEEQERMHGSPGWCQLGPRRARVV
jgi:hypothetical protein